MTTPSATSDLDIEPIKARVQLAQRMFGVSFDGYPDTERAPVDIQRDRDRSALLREVERLRAALRSSDRAVKEPDPALCQYCGHHKDAHGVNFHGNDGCCSLIEGRYVCDCRGFSRAAEGLVSSPASQLKQDIAGVKKYLDSIVSALRSEAWTPDLLLDDAEAALSHIADYEALAASSPARPQLKPGELALPESVWKAIDSTARNTGIVTTAMRSTLRLLAEQAYIAGFKESAAEGAASSATPAQEKGK